MSEDRKIEGRCACGAVTVTAVMPKPIIRACHCDMCRRQTSSMFMSLGTEQDSIRVEGDVRIFDSSDWAERAFCPTCGSTLWYATKRDGAKHLAAGLFPDAGGAPLKLEFFADMCPHGYALAGDHRKMTTEETVNLFSPD